MSRPVRAERRTIPAGFDWFAQQMIEPEKVAALRRHLRAGGEVPPVVVAEYGGRFMPLDGHHRIAAHDLEGLPLDAWVISGKRFERLDRVSWERAENLIDCGGVVAMEVAPAWDAERAATK